MEDTTFSPGFEGSEENDAAGGTGPTRSPYNIFCDFCVEALQTQHKGVEIDINMTKLLRQCAARWKKMTEIEKKSFRILAKREEDKYEREMGILTSTKNNVEAIQAEEKEEKMYEEVSQEEEEETVKSSEPVENIELNGNSVPMEVFKSRRTRRKTNTLTLTKRSIDKAQNRGSRKKTDSDIETKLKKTRGRKSYPNAYSKEELQGILDYLCDMYKNGHTTLFKICHKAKQEGKFPNRTSVALHQQLMKTILPNLNNFVCSAEDRELILDKTRHRYITPASQEQEGDATNGGDDSNK